MDPVTITTTLVTFVTFLKDIVYLAQEIQRSVNKVPQNKKSIRKLCDEVVAGLTELRGFYDTRGHLLDGSSELHEALSALYAHLRAIHKRCHELFPPKAKGRINQVLIALRAWTKCDEIEAEIEELKERVHDCYIRFTAFAVARLEQPLVHIASSTTRIEQSIQLVLDEHQRIGLSRMEGVVTSLHFELEPPVSLGTSNVQLSSNDVAALYLHQQIETITESLGILAASQTFVDEQPRGPYLQPFKSVIIETSAISRNGATHHREVVLVALQIIQLLQDKSVHLSIQEGAWDMVNLAIRLYGLEMYSDALTIGVWTVDLYRTLVSTNPGVYEPYLALALRNLSRYKRVTGDSDGALQAIEECIARQRAQLRTSSSLNASLELSNSLIELWGLVREKGDPVEDLHIAQESLDILEVTRTELAAWEAWIIERGPSFMDPRAFDEGTSPLSSDFSNGLPSPPSVPKTWDEDAALWLEFNTGRALHSLSYSLQDTQRLGEAYDAEKRALRVFADICERHPGTFEDNLAGCLVHLCRPPLSNSCSSSEILSFLVRAVNVYRELYTARPTKYGPLLVEILWEYATQLHATGSLNEALRTSNEAVEIVRRVHNDRQLLADALQHSSWSLRCLEQHETALVLRREAVDIYRSLFTSSPSSPSTHGLGSTKVPDSLCDLATDLQLVGKLEDAVEVCEEAVEGYRTLFSTNEPDAIMPDSCKVSLARGLSLLCHCLNSAKEFDRGMHAGWESLELHQVFDHDDQNVLHDFLTLLSRISFSACHARDPHAIAKSTAIIKHCRAILLRYKDEATPVLMNALRNHDYILTKHLRFREAVSNGEELLGLFRSIPFIGNCEVAADFINALVTHAANLDDVGRLSDAEAACQQAIEIGQSLSIDQRTPELAFSLADALASSATCLRSLGRYEEALSASVQSVKLYRDHPEPIDGTLLACRLQNSSIDLCKADRLDEAIKLGQEAIHLCRTSPALDTVFAEARLPYVLESFSTIVANAGDESTAMQSAREAIYLFHNIKSSSTTLVPWSFAEPLYANALTTLASRLAATGDYQASRRLLHESKDIYDSLTYHAPGYCINLAKTLDLLAVVLCAMGLHIDGVEVEKDIIERQSRLEAFNPDLARGMQIGLDDFRTSKSQRKLRQALPCCELSHPHKN